MRNGQNNNKRMRNRNNNNNNNNNNNHKKLQECFSGTNPPPCILADKSIAYDCKDDRHFKSPNDQCIYWNKSTNGWDLRLKLSGNNDGGYACRFAEAKIVESNKDLPVCKEKIKGFVNTSKITVGYGDLGGYSGKAKIVIKNQDTGETLVKHDINFAKLRASEGNDCCYKVYTFDKSLVHKGDTISALVTGGGGSWESGPEIYKDNLRVSVTLDEIGEDESGNYITSNNNDNDTNDDNNSDNKKDNSDENICDSDPSTTAPSCDDFLKEQEKDNDNNDNNDNDFQKEFELPPEEEPEFEDEVTGNISSS